MELNENTIKVGSSLYFLNILQDKDYGNWCFLITVANITYLEKDRSGHYYFVKFKTPWANQFILAQDNWRHRQGQLWNNELIGNDKPVIKLKEYRGTFQNEWSFFCHSFKDLTHILKETVFNGKGNEVTKRKRERMYRELVKQWTKSDYRENFEIRLK